MMNMTKGLSNGSVAMNERLYDTGATGNLHEKKAFGKKQGNKIELHFHMIGEFIDLKLFSLKIF